MAAGILADKGLAAAEFAAMHQTEVIPEDLLRHEQFLADAWEGTFLIENALAKVHPCWWFISFTRRDGSSGVAMHGMVSGLMQQHAVMSRWLISTMSLSECLHYLAAQTRICNVSTQESSN